MAQTHVMNRRQRVQAAFDGKVSDWPPVSIRLDLWHTDAVASGSLPPELAGLSPEQVEDYLGFSRAARFRRPPKWVFPSCQVVERRTEREIIKEYRFPGRTLTHRAGRDAQAERMGLRSHSLGYPLATREDYVTLLDHMGDARLEFAPGRFADFDTATCDAGLPMLIVACCPAHMLMISWAGYENFYLHLADFPDVVEKLVAEMERVYRRDLWPYVQASGARLILHGAHFSTQMTPRPVFRQFFLPYFSQFNELMHRSGRQVVFHADAECAGLVQEVLECGFDGADCLATAPLVPKKLEDYLEAWQGKVVCWGGLPSTIFDPTFPADRYEQHVRQVVSVMRGRADCILGASDNVMPGADWERLRLLARLTREP